jgi:acetyl-CoA carboxylase biotin carboxyl carrier protein
VDESRQGDEARQGDESRQGDEGRQRPADRLIEEVLPALVARLGVGSLAEIEVRSGAWRVRLRRDLRPTPRAATPQAGTQLAPRGHPAAGGEADGGDDPGMARSPAVGYFAPTPDLVVGRSVRAGDQLGRVDVLGVAHDVTSPVDGLVGRILAEPGQAVEYGQPLALVHPGPAQG